MSAEYATFGLAPATRAGGLLPGGDYQVHRDFVDFVVDGRPLLFRLSGLDAVSPLASDVPPSLFTWRDFAWQTGTHADLELGGYHGIGPFRFRGTEYRTALAALLDGRAPGARRRVLLIGARVALLARLAAALRTIGIGADIAQTSDGVPADELRAYGAVVFGRSGGAGERDAVRRAFTAAGVDVPCVEGLPPVLPLLVARTEQALDGSPPGQRRLTDLTVSPDAAELGVTSPCRVRLTAYRVDRLSRTHSRELFDAVLEPGRHRVPLDARAVRGEAYVVARTAGTVLVTAVGRR